MTCANCGNENPAGQKFCNQCGNALEAACTNCGSANAPGSRFCGNCGSSLSEEIAPTPAPPATEGSEPVAERRLVSVLFADLVGFTPYSEGRDPEDVRGLLTEYFDRAREVIEGFGGVVDKFIGDAVTAVWGGVTALEDDAERAVRAGLELVDVVAKLGAEVGAPELGLRVGVLTGEASVGPGGNQMGLVAGDMVNTASRLQSVAEPGTVLVGESTYLATQSAIAFEAVGAQTLKGKELPVTAWQAVRLVAERGGRGRAEMLEPPFVGRVDELRLLKDLLAAVGREGRARLVSIIGEAGIGKSRLVWEFEKYVDGLIEDIYWHEGRSPAYGDGVTYWAVAEMIRRRARIAETDPPEESRSALMACLEDYLPDGDERHWVEPRIAAVLGLADAPSGDRAELDAAIRAFFEAVSRRGTTVLVFEDLHWADPGLLEFVEELTDWSRNHPILVVTLARADLLERRPSWGAGRRGFVSSHLGPLSDADMADLVTGIVPDIPASANKSIVERAAGVPLFAVEILRMLIAQGDLVATEDGYLLEGSLDELAVPDSVRSVIGARLDRLEPGERDLLQAAAVLGQTFSHEGLVAISDLGVEECEAQLAAFSRDELVEPVRDPRSPERGQYRFVQSLIREVAVGRMSREVRRARHLEAAAYYERLNDPELAMVVAAHYLDAFQATPDGEEAERIRERALRTMTGALHRAAALYSYEQVLSLGQQALDLADETADRAPVWELMSDAATKLALSDDAETYSSLALDHYQTEQDQLGINRAVALLAFSYIETQQPQKAIELLRPHLEQNPDHADDSELAAASGLYARGLLLTSSPLSDVVEASEQALAAAERLGLMPVLVDALITRGTAIGDLGRLEEAKIVLNGAVELADRHDLTHSSMRGRNNAAHVFSSMDPELAYQATEEAFAMAKRVGNRSMVLFLATNLTGYYGSRAEYDKVASLLRDPMLEDAPPHYQSAWKISQALGALWRGEEDELTKLETEARSLGEEERDDFVVRGLEALEAYKALYVGDLDRAYEQGLTMAARDWTGALYGLGAAWISAVISGDVKRIQEVTELASNNYRFQLERHIRYLESVASLADGSAEGVAEAEAVIEEFERLGRPLDAISARGGIVRSLPDGDPDRARLLDEVRRRCEELGLTGLGLALERQLTTSP